MKQLKVKKGQILQNKGDIESKIYQVESGLLRSYSIDEKGKEHIFTFASEGWIMADNTPMGEPSDLFIDALEDSVIIQREKNFTDLQNNELTELGIKKIIKRLAVLQKRVIMLMSATALERYEHFIETYPDIVQRVPQKMIASYLGITPEALSTVKRQMMKRK